MSVVVSTWLIRTVATSWHMSCSCRIGPDSDRMGVVDQYCRVSGMEGLRVATGYGEKVGVLRDRV